MDKEQPPQEEVSTIAPQDRSVEMQGIKEQLSSSEQREAMVPNHVIIFGVSIPKYSKEYLSDHEFNYHIVAQPGAQIRDIASDIRKYSTTDFDKSCVAGVVLDIGSNSLLSNQTFDQNMEDFQDMLSAAMVTFPQAEVLVSGILSRFDDEVLDRAAETYNIHFAKQCKRFGDKVKFVDLRNHFISGRLPRFARKLQEAVEYHLSTDPEHVRWKQAFSTAVQKVGLPKAFHQGPPSPENINRNPPSQRKVKPNYHSSCRSGNAVQNPTRSTVKKTSTARKRSCYPEKGRQRNDISNWRGWARCQGPTAGCSPRGQGPKWEAEYLIRPHCFLYKRIPQTSVAEKMLRDDSNNARRGKKRKIRHEHTEDPNPRDLDMLDQLLSMVQDQRCLTTPTQDAGPKLRKRRRHSQGIHHSDPEQSAKEGPRPANHTTAANKPERNDDTAHNDTRSGQVVYLRMFDSRLLTVEVVKDSGVLTLCNAISSAYGNRVPAQGGFYFKGLKLKNGVALQEQGVTPESTIHFNMGLPGGSDKDKSKNGDKKQTDKKDNQATSHTFGGMRKGFLFGGTTKKKTEVAETVKAPGKTEASEAGSADGSPEYLKRHMTQWTSSEVQDWLQTVGRLRSNEVKPFVAEKVDGRVLWMLSKDVLDKYFSSSPHGARLKIQKAVSEYKGRGGDNLEVIEEERSVKLPNDVEEWSPADVKIWLSQSVHLDSDDISQLMLNEYDGFSLLLLDEGGVTEAVPELRKGPLIKLIHFLNNLKGANGRNDEESIEEQEAGEKSPDQPHQALIKAKISLSNTTEASVRPKELTKSEASCSMLDFLRLCIPDMQESPGSSETTDFCNVSLIYARTKKKTELDTLFNFIVITKSSGGSLLPNELWENIRKRIFDWLQMLPEETSRLYEVKDIKLSPETVTNIHDKKSTSLSSKEVMLNPISNVDSSMLARIQNRTNVVLVENSLLTDEVREYRAQYAQKGQSAVFTFSKESHWHGSFSDENMDRGILLKNQPESLEPPLASEEQTEKDSLTSQETKSTSKTAAHQEAPYVKTQSPFQFDKDDIEDFKYQQGSVLTVMESGNGNLISPSHEFKVFQQISLECTDIPTRARNYFVFETLRFVTACMNARRNGTIHFGIGDDVDKKYKHGEIVGVEIQDKLKAKFKDKLKEFIAKCTNENWHADAVSECVRPIRFVPVDCNEQRYVLEIDVVPSSAITEKEVYYIKFPKEIACTLGKYITANEYYLFYRNRDTSEKRNYTGPQFDTFRTKFLPKLVKNRVSQEQAEEKAKKRSFRRQNYGKILESGLLGGETDLKTRYPILFVGRLDHQSHGCKQDVDTCKKLAFISEIPWLAIFDFDAGSEETGLCRQLRSKIKNLCLLHQPEEKFSEITDHRKLADAIVFPERTCWIFSNGREKLSEPYSDPKEWNGTNRAVAVTNAISFYARSDIIPKGKAAVVFLICSEKDNIMLTCFRNCYQHFNRDVLCIFEGESQFEYWANALSTDICTPENLERRTIIDMPWDQIHENVKRMKDPQFQSECQIPSSCGTPILLTEKFKKQLDDLEVVCFNQCEDPGLDPGSREFDDHSNKKEVEFYRGNEVQWLNFYFTDYHKDHVMQRDQFSVLLRLIHECLEGEKLTSKKRILTRTLYYQAGSGATTLGKHVLWTFRKEIRCCVVQRITPNTASQILALRKYREHTENDCLQVLVLVDNKDDDLVRNLVAKIDHLITKEGDAGPVQTKSSCIILLCKHSQEAKKMAGLNPTESACLVQSVSKKELLWLEKKQRSLEETRSEEDLLLPSEQEERDSESDSSQKVGMKTTSTPVNLDTKPTCLIKFMILRKNFDRNFIKNVVANSFSKDANITGNETLLLMYTALLNFYTEKEDSYIPSTCAETLMGITGCKSRPLDTILSHTSKIFLIRIERKSLKDIYAYKFVDPILAMETLQKLAGEKVYSDIACQFLESKLISCTCIYTEEIRHYANMMLKRRKKYVYGDEEQTQFSILIEDICKAEGYQVAVKVLEKGLYIFEDPIIAQTLARLLSKKGDFEKAHKYAEKSLTMEEDNSYLLTTAGRVYYEEMMKKFEMKYNITIAQLKEAVHLTRCAVDSYIKSQEANYLKRYPFNLMCYIEEIRALFQLFYIMEKMEMFRGTQDLKRYLVDRDFIPEGLQTDFEDCHDLFKYSCFRLYQLLEFVDRYLTYNKKKYKDIEVDMTKKVFHRQLRSYTRFFGTFQKLMPEDNPVRWKRLKACELIEGNKVNFSRTFELVKKGRLIDAITDLKKVIELLTSIEEKEADDLEGLISAALTLATVNDARDANEFIPSFKQVYEWSVLFETLAGSKQLEPHFFLTMFLWPRDNMDIHYEDGRFRQYKDKLSSLYEEQCPQDTYKYTQAHRRLTTSRVNKMMPTTHFFLTRKKGLQAFIHISQLNTETQKNFDRDQFWESELVQQTLERLEGICEGRRKIIVTPKDIRGIEIKPSRPVEIAGDSQEKVTFFLGFSWAGPVAYHVKVCDEE
ncbi:sterile alpha motif domain-containing protein 9-like isoform X2 [Branchiostoma floridae x Branchiostoma belcheri]